MTLLNHLKQLHGRWLLTCAALLATVTALAQDQAPPRPAPDARMIFIAADGDDGSSGLSPDDALATLVQGLARLRAGSPDWLILERGSDYTLGQAQLPSLGDTDAPVVITSWGEGEVPRLFLEDGPRDALAQATQDDRAIVYDLTILPTWVHIATVLRNPNPSTVSLDGARNILYPPGNPPRANTFPGHTQDGTARVHTHMAGSDLFVSVNKNPSTRLSSRCLVSDSHSGDGHHAAASADRAWVMWIEDENLGNGTPCYAVELDDSGNQLGRWFVGLADPAREGAFDYPHTPDAHSKPQIFRSGNGILHMLMGAHNGRLLYARSNTPDTLANGWTDWIEIGDSEPSRPYYGYTYPATLLIDDTLHIVARWNEGSGAIKLVYFNFNLDTHESSRHIEITRGPESHIYAVFFQSLTHENRKLKVDYHTHFYTRDNEDLRPGETGNWELDLDP